jgi:hypothetical protein
MTMRRPGKFGGRRETKVGCANGFFTTEHTETVCFVLFSRKAAKPRRGRESVCP